MKPYCEKSGITIYHGDCREVLPTFNDSRFDAVLMDPPYGIRHSSSHGASWMNTNIAGDDTTELRDYVCTWARAREIPCACFGTWKVHPPTGTRATLVWDKGPAFGMGDLSFPWKPSWEEIYIIGDGWQGKRDEGVLRGSVVVSWESKGRRHPHEKPVWLFAQLLAKLPTAERLMDPFCGTGPLLRAAKDAGCRAVGIEIEERYCEIAARRLEQEAFQWSDASSM